MRDVGLTVAKDVPPAEAAVLYIARRIQNDPDLAYLISPGTGAYDVMLEAIKPLIPSADIDPASVLRCRETERKARIVEYRDRVHDLERRVEDLEQLLRLHDIQIPKEG